MARRAARFAFEQGEPIESLEQFLAEIRRFAGRGSAQTYFRGQGESVRELMPSIGRRQHYAGKSLVFSAREEQSLLKRFRRYAYEYFKRVPTEWETLFLARHHGLPTRLLDWTSNPLVSLYFAAAHRSDERVRTGDDRERKLEIDGTVWAIATRNGEREDLDIFSEQPSPLDVRGIRLVFPINPSPRLTAQSGVFTLHGDPWTDMVKCADEAYPDCDLDVARLKRWTVPGTAKPEIILALDRVSINSRTLFPDLDGLARGLWETEILREAFSR